MKERKYFDRKYKGIHLQLKKVLNLSATYIMYSKSNNKRVLMSSDDKFNCD